ncbi:MAG: ABC transporter permease [Lachnospiraceae bacterium]|nr:ABC transporter permease [Lachnospiraceae bacterium]
MIRYLIKNNMKLMLRSPANILLFIVAPLGVMAILSNAFSSLMQSYEKKGPFEVGYVMSAESFYAPYEEALVEVAKEADITLKEFQEGDAKEWMDRYDLTGFVEFHDETYLVWTREDAKVEGQTLEYLLNTFVEELDRGKRRVMSAMASGQPVDMEAIAKGSEDPEISLEIEHPNFMPAIDSRDYYGIIEIIYFGWCALVCAAGILGNEKKYGITKKYQVAGLSQLQIYLTRLLPMFLVVILCEGIAAVIAALFLNVHWGNQLLLSAILMIFMILAASAFELMIYSITDSMVLSIIIAFAVVWIWGFLGGSFETYMFSTVSQSVKALSPIYHGNRAMVELSCMGHSDYFVSSLLYCGAMAVGCSGIALFASAVRKRG